ncbi:MAG TPA: NHLP bacteriocin export ABC transporter permease/ATPase subunit [Spirochaetota bacterium]|nr:NHLP bacteriocin export ABC transporter permease/ATPase subunit [Spirochaetota bacterium]
MENTKISDFFNAKANNVDNPVVFNDPFKIWFIIKGKVDIFLVKIKEGVAYGRRKYLFTLEENSFICGYSSIERGEEYSLIGVGSRDARIAEIDRDSVQKFADAEKNDFVSKFIDNTIIKLYCQIVKNKDQKRYRTLDGAQTMGLEREETVLIEEGVKWIKHTSGESRLLGADGVSFKTGDDFFPIPHSYYIKCMADSTIILQNTNETIADNAFFDRILSVFVKILIWFLNKSRMDDEEERERIQKKINLEKQILQSSLKSLSEVMNPRKDSRELDNDEDIIGVMKVVCRRLNMDFKIPPGVKIDLSSLAAASNLQIRKVVLKDKWHTSDNGLLVGFLESAYGASKTENQDVPVALIPSARGCYKIYNHSTGKTVKVDAQTAHSLKSTAYMFYKPLPDKKLTTKDLFLYAFEGVWKYDLMVMALSGVFGGILSVIFPIITGALFNSIIPRADRSGLIYMGILLFVCICSGMIFQITKVFTMLRIETKMDSSLQAAVWDRLINLPTDFFKKFTSGDLAQRANGIGEIRRAVSGGAITSVLAVFFSIFNLILLFFYDSKLAWIAVLLAVILIFVTLILGIKSTAYLRKIVEYEGKISGRLLQIINGIAKFRTSHSEEKAFALWAEDFAKKRKFQYKSDNILSYVSILNIIFPLVVSTILFFFVSIGGLDKMPIGNFIAFVASYNMFLSALLELSRNFIKSLTIVPLYERDLPILETIPERDKTKSDPGVLEGNIDFNRVTFRYSSASPAIIKNISLKIKSGQFVAIVGPSGSGKSTLMRLILGFEKAESGSIAFDGQDISTIDLRKVRKQTGAVLQNGKLTADDIYSNIVGSSNDLTLDDAWSAAETAGLADDIREMPMGMHTVISEGGGTLSGGQRQRLLIARAIVKKPKILLFDEATSALDNKTQALISKSIEKLNCTRIVIAHRLSTIINADKIFVLVNGALVEEGTYEELIAQNGFFTELAKRQIA